MPNVVDLDVVSNRCRSCRFGNNCALNIDSENSPTDSSSRMRLLHRGEKLFGEGSTADALYRVRSGVIKISVTDAEGREQVTGFCGPGDFVGLDAVYDEQYTNEATALDTTCVCILPKHILSANDGDIPHRLRQLIKALSQHVHDHDRLQLSLAQDTAAQRMANFLLNLSAQREAAGLDGDDLALPMSRAEIANYLALAVETVSRMLTAMQREGILEVARSYVRLLDREALISLAHTQKSDVNDAEDDSMQMLSRSA